MAIRRLIFQRVSFWLAHRNLYIIQSLNYRDQKQALPVNLDYVRYSTLGLCYEEILKNNVAGSVAELGVYKGDFSKRLNQLFPDRKLYLFDTFSGFDERDISIEHNKGYSDGSQDFSNTSIDLVLGKMVAPHNCIIKKGIFPQTIVGINDTFCFVSLDADLFEPIYQGLKFFYPRLENGGYIFVHDFNNKLYKGARQAVMTYCNENEVGYTPIPDSGGTVIITKNKGLM